MAHELRAKHWRVLAEQGRVLAKHRRILVRYWAITFSSFSQFTWDVWLSIVQFVFYMCRSLVFWWAVTGVAGDFAGWTMSELALFTAVSYLPGLHSLFWNFWNSASFSDKILRGELDKYLARPVHPLFALAAEDVHLAHFLKYFLPPLAMALVFIARYDLPVTGWSFVGGYLLLSAGKLVLTMMRATASMLAFRHGEVSGLEALLFQFTALGSYPVTAFPDALRFFLGYLLPAAFTATYPTLFMLGKADGIRVFGIAAGLCAFWVFVMFKTWSVTARDYESPGG
jgi:ABC-2 type transport system permease protein